MSSIEALKEQERTHEQKEEWGKVLEAVEFYDRVFSLDINFADVTERLRTLR